VAPEHVKGVGFDATCSLAVVTRDGSPVSVSRSAPDGGDQDEADAHLGHPGEWNVILWADHRAEDEAEAINATGEGVLQFVGGTMSVSHKVASTVALTEARDGGAQDCLAQETHAGEQVPGLHFF
jgi:ribulose kinase